MTKLPIHLLSLLLILISCKEQVPATFTLTEDGAWCWFSDPRALYLEGSGGKILTGWVKKDGTIEVCVVSSDLQEMKYEVLYPQLEVDDHDNPAFAQFADNTLFAAYAWHSDKKGVLTQWGSSVGDQFSFNDPEKIVPFDSLMVEKFPKVTYTYANPYTLKTENERLYCFGRWIGYKPNMIWSDDKGKTWSNPQVIISSVPFDGNNRPYVKYFSDGNSRIHMIFTDGHPRVEPLNSVYYAYYESGAFYKVDGTKICNMEELPFQTKDASVVYQADSVQGRAWIWDIVADAEQKPVIAYTRYPNDMDHRYHYTRYDGEKWLDVELCKGGKWFPQTVEGETEREPNYSGGLSIHPSKLNVVFLSREVNDVFEIERWERDTDDVWSTQSITSKSINDNVRPYVPRGLPATSDEVVLWMENKKYIHYTQFDVSIKGKLIQ